MYRKHHNRQLSIEEFHVPFGGTLDPENRWVLFPTLIPSDEIEEAYTHQFSPTTGALAKPALLAFGALFIKQRLGFTEALPPLFFFISAWFYAWQRPASSWKMLMQIWRLVTSEPLITT